MARPESDDGEGFGPWFRRRPQLSVAVSIILFFVVLTIRVAAPAAEVVVPLVAVLPVALLGMTFGLLGGLAGGALGLATIGSAGVAVHGVPVAAEWMGRGGPLVLIGGLVGAASDRLRYAHQQQHRLRCLALRHREAAELNDSIIQSLVAAKWAVEGGRVDQGLDVLTSTIVTAEALVARMLEPDDVLGDAPHPRWQAVSHPAE